MEMLNGVVKEAMRQVPALGVFAVIVYLFLGTLSDVQEQMRHVQDMANAAAQGCHATCHSVQRKAIAVIAENTGAQRRALQVIAENTEVMRAIRVVLTRRGGQ